MFLFILTSDSCSVNNIVALSATQNLKQTLEDYIRLHDETEKFRYVGIWETEAQSHKELSEHLETLQKEFARYRLMRERKGDSEWFDFQRSKVYPQVRDFLKECKFVKREVALTSLKYLLN